MGAYYTKEDITEYISKNTIIPFLFDKAKKKCKIAFDGDRTVWDLLIDDPDRYFYDAVTKGIKNDEPKQSEDRRSQLIITNEIKSASLEQLSENIAIGLDTEAPDLLDRRKDWNTKTPEEFALPTEIWRETIARWQRYFEVRQIIENGEVRSINDLITYNLNIRQLAQDVIESWEGPELIRAFYKAITQITVLDPTVGSGAFLFAALNILEPLYEACIDRMQNFVDELPTDSNKSKFSDFKEILAKIDKHPSRRYFIYKSIIINNLYGVDIMDEAVEICKLRLFLKLVAQVNNVDKIEPLPDIDFNIRAGNTLVGFASYQSLRDSIMEGQADLLKDQELKNIDEKARDVQCLYDVFLEAQMEEDNSTSNFKQELRNKLNQLNTTLNHYLAGEYGIDPANKTKFNEWLKTHQPFHWFVEFYGILANGGFDVIIGNPPYIEYSKVRNDYKILNYKTEKCGNLYAFVYERVTNVCSKNGLISFIIPLSGFSTERMDIMQKTMIEDSKRLYLAHFSGDRNPAELFTGVKNRLSIFVSMRKDNTNSHIFSTNYNKWYTEARKTLFPNLTYFINETIEEKTTIPKIGDKKLKNIIEKLNKNAISIHSLFNKSSPHQVLYNNTPIHWTKSFNFQPYFWNERDGVKLSSQLIVKSVSEKKQQSLLVSVLNSTLFYMFWIVYSDCYHLISREINNFRIPNINDRTVDFEIECNKLMLDYQNKSKRIETEYQTTGLVKYDQYDTKKSKPIIDEIDKVLAEHYGFTQEELDFIINYDIKYRMGKELNN